MIILNSKVYQNYLEILAYVFVFSLCFDKLNVFGINLDYLFTKITMSLLIFFSLFDLNFWNFSNKNSKYTLVLLLYFVTLTLSSYLNISLGYTSYFDYLFFLNILVFHSLVNIFSRRSDIIKNALFYFCIGNIVLTFFYFLGIGQVDMPDELEGRATIFGYNQNFLGLSLTVSALVILNNLYFQKYNLIKKLFFIICFLLVTYFMVTTGSRTAFVAFVLGLSMMLILNNKISAISKIVFFLIFFTVSFFLIIFFSEDFTLSQRLTDSFVTGDTAGRDVIWSGLFHFFSDYILLGVGKTGYARIIGDLSPHNVLIEIFIYTGLTGLFIFVYLIKSFFTNILKVYKNQKNILPLIIFIPFFGILLTGQLFDQKLIWFFMACLTQIPNNSLSNE